MNWFWMNVPLMVVFFAAITGIPLWLTFRHTDTCPVAMASSSPADDVAAAAVLALEAELVDAA
jgi:hypothetical protein